MTENPTGAPTPEPTGDPEAAPRFTDRRRIDPETGAVRGSAPAGAGPAGSGGPDVSADDVAAAQDPADPLAGLDFEPSETDAELIQAQTTAAERLEDLQRLQAEFVNYRKRVDRDRSVARDQAVAGVL